MYKFKLLIWVLLGLKTIHSPQGVSRSSEPPEYHVGTYGTLATATFTSPIPRILDSQ